MRPINLSEDQKVSIFEKFVEKFEAELKNYGFNSGNTTLSVKLNFDEVAKEKVNIIYTQQAYLRMQALVDFFDSEVAWYGLCERLDEKTFRIYDVKVCKQYVTSAKVDTEDEDTFEFFSNLTDDEAEHMHFQAHSHVKMSTGASAVDLQNQQDVVKNMGKEGFYIFQIWNKNGDINTYLYDIDHNTFYDRKDVSIQVEDSMGTIDDFLVSVADLVSEKKYYPYQYNKGQYSTQAASSEKKIEVLPESGSANATKENDDDDYQPSYLPGYYGGQNYGRQGWDW